MKRHPLSLAAAAAAAGLIVAALAGCTPSTRGVASAHSTLTPFPGITPSASAAASADESQKPPKLPPIEKFTLQSEGLYGTPQQLAAKKKQQYTAMQDKIASCMDAQGFRFTPTPYVAPPTLSDATVDGITDVELSDKTWVSTYGYGVVHTQIRAIGKTNDGSDGGALEAKKKESPATPDDAYLATLSQGQRDAYDLAMYGPKNNTSADLSTQGCFGKATLATQGPDLQRDAQFQTFWDAAAQFESTFASWPGMSKLESDWSSCMAGKGRPGFARQADAATSIGNKYGALISGTTASNRPIAALTTLASQEVSLALVDLDCRTKVDYHDRYFDIQTKAENQFLADHKAEVDAIRAASAQAGK